LDKKISLDNLIKQYKEIGSESYDIEDYRVLLNHARNNTGRVKLHGGFLPRPYTRTVMQEGLAKALSEAKSRGYVSTDETCEASD
jgi:hypothetical protein